MFTKTLNHFMRVDGRPGFWICPVDRLDEGRARVATSLGVPVDDVIDYPQLRCRCCGNPAYVEEGTEHVRCHKHRDKNPCAIEGCDRMHTAKGHLHDGSYYLCRDHWRLTCPPKSKWRRVNNRFFRTAKKLGCSRTERWPRDLENRYWRYFGGLVARARRLVAGDHEGAIDVDEIHRMFGLDA